MIESKKGEVTLLGSVSELLADLSAVVEVLLEAITNEVEKDREEEQMILSAVNIAIQIGANTDRETWDVENTTGVNADEKSRA